MSPRNAEFDEAALESMREEIADELAAYRAALEQIEPSSRHRASMERMLVELVRQDVHRQWQRRSLRVAVVTAWRRWNDAWRDLVGRSLLFRLTSQGAMALGAGLVLAILITSPDSEKAAWAGEAPRMEAPEPEPIPVPAPESLGADAFRRTVEAGDRRALATPVRRRKR